MFTPYQYKGRRPCENRPNTGVLGVLYIRSNRNDAMRHMPLFYIRTTQSSEMADAPKITFRSSGIQTDFHLSISLCNYPAWESHDRSRSLEVSAFGAYYFHIGNFIFIYLVTVYVVSIYRLKYTFTYTHLLYGYRVEGTFKSSLDYAKTSIRHFNRRMCNFSQRIGEVTLWSVSLIQNFSNA